MTPLVFTIKCHRHGTHEIAGKLIAPGIAVGWADFPGDDPNWSVTHVRSGLAFVGLPSPELAAAVALDLGSTGIDWEATAGQLQASIATERAVRRVLDRHNVNDRAYTPGPRAHGTMLADVAVSRVATSAC